MRLYDSLTKDSKDFPAGSGPVSVYACGPTVYHYAHIGNLRTFLTVDLLRRYLEYKGRKVKLVMNITDVGHMLNDADQGEDKMEAAAAKEGKTPEEIAAFYEKAFFADLDALNFRKEGTTFPRATENIEEMKEMIEELVASGKAYVKPSGIYYSVAAFPAYGKLSGNSVEKLEAGARVEVNDDKDHPADFALWIHNPNHVMQWEGPRGMRGYPGWHIECSAMSRKYLGETIDLHCGGEDLKFPHHECEIAQSEGANGVTFSKHWLHVTYLVVDGEKMSKSKGNFYTLQDLLDKGYSAAAVRWLLLSAHYRTQLNFTLEGLKAAQDFVDYAKDTVLLLSVLAGAGVPEPSDAELLKLANPGIESAVLSEFNKAMDEDLNVSVAIAHLLALLRYSNGTMHNKAIGSESAEKILKTVSDIASVFGLAIFGGPAIEIPSDIQALADERQAARAAKDWAASDRLRDAIAAKGWTVEDTPQGPKLKKA